jgi:acylglycerol lipase
VVFVLTSAQLKQHMSEEEFECISQGGIKLKGRKWLPESTPTRLLCIVHGLGEHSGRYKHVAQTFCNASIAVYAVDLRGHGQSEGRKAHTPKLDYLIEDVQQLVATARREFNELPIVLFGHSMGGALSAAYLLRRRSQEVSGAIFQSSWFDLVHPPKPLVLSAARFLQVFAPILRLSHGLNPDDLSNDKKVVEDYINDPLVHNEISLQLFFSMRKASAFVKTNAALLELPVLFTHGNEDNITLIESSEVLAEKVSGEADFVLWEGRKHEPHNDNNNSEVLEYYIQWIKKTIPEQII